jgi:hypothetical protein
MPEYLLLFVGLAAPTAASDAQTAEYTEKWGRWMGDLAAAGDLVSGAPLESRGMVVERDAVSELELDRVDIGGYAVIRAASDDQAVAAAGQAPHIALGGTTIVRPIMASPQ